MGDSHSQLAHLEGVLAIVHTPFDDNDMLDWESFQRQVDWAFDVGAQGLGTGMVSETLRLTTEERTKLVEQLVRYAQGRGPVFASVGAESTKQAVEYARHAEGSGCAAVMAIPPVVSAAGSEHLLEYYETIAESTQLPLIVQDASGYVGQTIPLGVSVHLLDRFGADKILFKPEAAPLGPCLSLLRDATAGRARIYEGSGGISIIDCFRRGITGTMPGTDVLDAVVELWRSLQTGNEDRAYQIYFPLCALVNMQLQGGLDGFLAIEKYLLVKRGIFTSTHRRRPYRFELDEETAREVDRLFERLRQSL